MDIRQRMEEMRLRRRGLKKERGAWKETPKSREISAYEKYKEQYMEQAAEERGKARARKEATAWKNRPTTGERFQQGFSLFSGQMKKGARSFGKSQKGRSFDLGVSEMRNPMVRPAFGEFKMRPLVGGKRKRIRAF